jgi:hypothetical protein
MGGLRYTPGRAFAAATGKESLFRNFRDGARGKLRRSREVRTKAAILTLPRPFGGEAKRVVAAQLTVRSI